MGREDTYEGRRLPDPRVYGKEEVDVDVNVSSDYRAGPRPAPRTSRRFEEDITIREEGRFRQQPYAEVDLSRDT